MDNQKWLGSQNLPKCHWWRTSIGLHGPMYPGGQFCPWPFKLYEKKGRCPWAKYIVCVPPGQLQTLLPCGMILLSHQIMDVPLSHNRVVWERQKQAATAARTINIAHSQPQISWQRKPQQARLTACSGVAHEPLVGTTESVDLLNRFILRKGRGLELRVSENTSFWSGT